MLLILLCILIVFIGNIVFVGEYETIKYVLRCVSEFN